MKGNDIVLSVPPRGVMEEGIVSGTPKPGTVMQIKAGTAPVNGRFTWEASSVTSGSPRMLALLLADPEQGKLPTDAYVSGTRCFLYFPLIGEEVNVLTAAEPGTGSADTFKIGDVLGVSNAGLAIPNSAYTFTPFTALEYLVQTPADTQTLLWVKVGRN